MFLRRMKCLTILCCGVLAAVLAAFAIVVAVTPAEGGMKSEGKDANYAANAYHEDDFFTATQAEFDAVLSDSNRGTTACALHGQAVYPYLIRSPHELAAVIRYGAGSEVARSACFQVVKESFPEITDLRAWTADGSTPIPYVAFLNFTGHFNFSGIRIAANFQTFNYQTSGLFRNPTGAIIENLDVALYGIGQVIGENAINCTIRNINVEHHIVSNAGTLHAVNRDSKKWYALSSIVTRNGVTNNADTDPAKCVIENCDVRYVFDYDGGESGGEFYWDVYAWGGIVWENSGTVRNCSVNYGDSKLDATNFGGITGYSYSSGKVQNCDVVIPSTGTKFFYNNRGSWGNGSVGGIVGTLALGASTSVGTGAEITGCTVSIASDTTDTNLLKVAYYAGMGGIVGQIEAYNAAKSCVTKISDCNVTGTNISGRFEAVAGIAGRVSADTAITGCSVDLTGRIDGYRDIGGLIGGDTGVNGSITKTVNVSDCEVVAKQIYSSYYSGTYPSGAIAGGLVGLMRYRTTLNFTRCNAYIGSIRSGSYTGAIGGFASDNSNTAMTATITDCTSLVGELLVTESATTGDVWGNITNKANVILKNVTYLKHLNRIYGTSYNGGTAMDVSGAKGIASGTAEYTAAVQTLQTKLDAAAKEVTGGKLTCGAAMNAAGDGVDVTFDFNTTDFAGYTIEGLYLSLQGDTIAGYTQLIGGGKVLGYLGAGNPAIGGQITCATLKKITYYGVPSDISNVRIKLRLVKGDTVKTLVYDHQGNLV